MDAAARDVQILLSGKTKWEIQYQSNSRYEWCLTLKRGLHTFPARHAALKRHNSSSMGVLKEYFCFDITQTESQSRDSLSSDHSRWSPCSS